MIFSPFNYAEGNQYGVEFTANYTKGGFNAYANFGFERGTGKRIVSGQFLFSPQELAFSQNHWVFLDHDQRYTLSAGASYTYKDTTVYGDLLYGSGLRSGFANNDELPGYCPVNLGFTHDFHLPEKYGRIQARFDVTNLSIKATNCVTGPVSGSLLRNLDRDEAFSGEFVILRGKARANAFGKVKV